MGELKLVQSQKKVAEQNKGMLVRKKAKAEKKLHRLRKELAGMRGEEEQRQKQRDTMRGRLIRPTVAGAPEDASEEPEE